MVYETLTEEDPNFQDYIIKIDRKKDNLIDEIEDLIEEDQEIFYSQDLNDNEYLNNIYFDRHLFQPLLCKINKIKTSPQGLEKSEEVFINLLKKYLASDEAKDIIKEGGRYGY